MKKFDEKPDAQKMPRVSFRLPVEHFDWLKSQPAPLSETIRAAVAFYIEFKQGEARKNDN